MRRQILTEEANIERHKKRCRKGRLCKRVDRVTSESMSWGGRGVEGKKERGTGGWKGIEKKKGDKTSAMPFFNYRKPRQGDSSRRTKSDER